MADLLDHVFALFCGQNSAHTWAPGGAPMPCCQRCTGLYFGACLALALHLICRPRLTGRFLAAHGFFLLLAAPFGFHWLPHGAVLRTVTGTITGFAIATFLWLVPAIHQPKLLAAKEPNALLGYGLGLAATLFLLPAVATAGGPAAGWVLSIVAAVGLLSLLILAVLNLALGLAGLLKMLQREP